MTKKRKRLQNLINGKELSFNDAKTILNDLGYQLMRVNGSHHIFRNRNEDTINLPVHNGKVKRKYIKMIRKKLLNL